MLCDLLDSHSLFLYLTLFPPRNPNVHFLHDNFYLRIVRLTFMLELFRFAIIQFGNFSVEW